MIRLDKFLSTMGLGTRSQVKAYLKKGLITVNGRVEVRPDAKVREQVDTVAFQGQIVAYADYEYFMFHKPAGCVSARTDTRHPVVLDYITDAKRSDLSPVGRLDLDTEGLLLITNDGALSHALLAPGNHVPKTYFARVEGKVDETDVSRFAQGLDIGEKKDTLPAKLEILSQGRVSEILLTITEGKFHQVKRMFEAADKKVVYLRRISMGSLKLDETLKPGEYRSLTQRELEELKNGSVSL